MKKGIIIGASSGIGHEVAKLLINEGWTLTVAARRTEPLETLKAMAPERVTTAHVDVTDSKADKALEQLFRSMGQVDLYFHSAGIGKQNRDLHPDIELRTMDTNAVGFTRMIGTAFRLFALQGHGHIACISSVAGTKGLGPAPAYSASKALQNTYLQALEQLAHSRRLDIRFTDIRPGFVNTPLLAGTATYPMLLRPESVARTIVKAIKHRRHVVTIDRRWQVIVALWRLIPNAVWRRLRL
ncbi:SDR family NAD(P)-dependent oxidoreductase [Prevotella sp.]|uniref:SDR family NAD(P)-dependent oxidoreductase n=1 Tax=Prevotella sp. TaxID=59823 RepID=UPI002F9579A6